MRAYINNRDWLTPLIALLEQLDRLGLDPVIVDVQSTYPPLLDWYSSSNRRVVKYKDNVGPIAGFITGLNDSDPYFVLTDVDLDISGVPDDTLQVLRSAMDHLTDIHKVGLSLEIDDLPQTPIAGVARETEAKFWIEEVTVPGPHRFWKGAIDTTFCLCRHHSWIYDAVRADRPYTARHLPWYHDIDKLDAEQTYYYRHVASPGVFYSGRMKQLLEEKQ